MEANRLLIGDVADEAGVNVQTLRYYERRGLLPKAQRSRSGYRQYSSDAVRLVTFIKRAQELGFTLREVEELLKLRAPGPKRREAARAAAAMKVRDIDAKMRDLRAMRAALVLLVEACACAGEAATCPILEALERKNRVTLDLLPR